MNSTSDGPQPKKPVSPAEAEALVFEERTRAARAELAEVLADLAEAQEHLGGHQMQQLLEANEKLVLDAMRVRGMAESAAQLVTELTRSSELDALTGLPNRLLLGDRFAQALTHARRNESRVALLFLDLDGFKQINDTLGHKVGDEVLKEVGRRLVECVREVDTVCRLGGDEFVLLLTEVSGAADPQRVAEKLIATVAQLTQLGANPVELSTSIGISVFPDDAHDIEHLVDCADKAMYQSKRAGGSRFTFFGELQASQARAADGLTDPSPQRPISGGRVRKTAVTAELREANEKLVLSSVKASEELDLRQRVLGEMESAARNKDEFLGILGHELRNPLAPLLMTLDVMRMRAGGRETKEHSTMRRHLGHLIRLVDDLQDVAKIATGKVNLHMESVVIADVATEAVAMARPLLEQRQHRFQYADFSEGATCCGDPVRLAQCISNILINAARYTPPGGAISLTMQRDDHQIVVKVKDNGRGISPQALPDIFSLFFQERTDPQSSDGGLGVGLALVRSLVSLHSGTVAAFSEGIGRGSEFVIQLPVERSDGALGAISHNRLDQAFSPVAVRRILVVDDNYDAADSLNLLLRMYGHDVWVATHPVAALNMIATAAPDLALLDIGLPGMDGYELAQRIRAQHPELEVALVA